MGSNVTPKTTALNGAAVTIVAIVVVAYTTIIIVAIRSYSDAKDVAAVLGVVVGPLAGIAAAAFGIKLSADAKVEAEVAQTETTRVKDGVLKIADELTADGRIEIRDGTAVSSGVVVADRLRSLVG